MNDGLPHLKKIPIFTALMLLVATLAFTQGGSSVAALSGLVVDASGAVIPGADVLVKNNANGVEARAVTDNAGRFVVPGLVPGTYTVTISLMGFKTVRVARREDARGHAGERQSHAGSGRARQKPSSSPAPPRSCRRRAQRSRRRCRSSRFSSCRCLTRTALDYVVSLPGVETSGASNTRASTINGLPHDGDRTSRSTASTSRTSAVQRRRLLHVHPADDGLGRGNHGVDVDPGRREQRRGRGTDPDDHPLGLEPVQRVGLQHVAQPGGHQRRGHADAQEAPRLALGPQHAVLVQQARPAEDGGRRLLHRRHPADRRQASALAARSSRTNCSTSSTWSSSSWPNSRQPDPLHAEAERRAGPLLVHSDNSGNIQTVNLLSIAAANGQTSTPDPTIAKLLRGHPNGCRDAGRDRQFLRPE